MFEHYTFGTQVHASRSTSDNEEVNIGPRDTSRILQCPSPLISPSAAPSAIDNSDAAPVRRPSVDSITQRLSKQHLRLVDDLSNRQPRHLPASPALSDSFSLQQCCGPLEIDDQIQHPPSPPETHRDNSSASSISMTLPLSLSCQMDEDLPVAAEDPRRLRRKQTTEFNNNPLNARTIQTLVADMITSGSQCNVYAPRPATPAAIEIDLNVNAEPLQLEVDEVFGEAEEAAWEETVLSIRQASMSSGIRKHGMLRYRTSADMALRCPNVVRSVPRMRKRRKREREQKSGPPAMQGVSAVATGSTSLTSPS